MQLSTVIERKKPVSLIEIELRPTTRQLNTYTAGLCTTLFYLIANEVFLHEINMSIPLWGCVWCWLAFCVIVLWQKLKERRKEDRKEMFI